MGIFIFLAGTILNKVCAFIDVILMTREGALGTHTVKNSQSII